MKIFGKNTLRFGSKRLSSSGENINPERELIKNVKTHVNIIRTRENTPKNTNSKYAPINFFKQQR
jgi:hypothetical protein